MHEMGLAQAIVQVVGGIAGGRPVERVRVQVGVQQAVAGDSLAFNFGLLVEGTELGGAVLDVAPAPGDAVRVEAVEIGGAHREVIRPPGPAVAEAPHDERDPHAHPAWR